jgi:hypothetical protein
MEWENVGCGCLLFSRAELDIYSLSSFMIAGRGTTMVQCKLSMSKVTMGREERRMV